MEHIVENEWKLQLQVLSEEEMDDPVSALQEAFEIASLQRYKDELWLWFVAACSEEYLWEHHYPGDLISFYDQVHKLIELAWLMDKKRSAMIKEVAISKCDFSVKKEHEDPEFRYWPRSRLTPAEIRQPYNVLNNFFGFFELPECGARLMKWLITAHSPDTINDGDTGTSLLFYELLVKLIEAQHLIKQREVDQVNQYVSLYQK